MPQAGFSRRHLLRTGLIGSCSALVGWSPLQKQLEADEARGRPSQLTITKVETFTLEHRLPKSIGPSVAQSKRSRPPMAQSAQCMRWKSRAR